VWAVQAVHLLARGVVRPGVASSPSLSLRGLDAVSCPASQPRLHVARHSLFASEPPSLALLSLLAVTPIHL